MKVSPAHGGQLVGGQAARQRLAQHQVGVPGHGRRRLGAEPDLIQQVALAPVPLAAGQRQEEEPADILPRPDRVVAAVDAPLIAAVGDLTADHEAADGDLLAVVLHGPVQRRAHQKSPVVVLAGSARQNVGDLRRHIHRRDEQRHRVLHTPCRGRGGPATSAAWCRARSAHPDTVRRRPRSSARQTAGRRKRCRCC